MDTIKRTRRPHGRRRGFTLMELLVVISIICLLMAIALPSLTSAREQGKRVTCLANMKNLSYSWLMFTHDNDDRLVSADTDWDVPPADHWVADGPFVPGNEVGGTERAIRAGRLWPYTGDSLDLYKCHSDASENLRSYAIARAMNGKTCNCEHDNIRPFRLYSQISMPSDRLVFADAATKLSWIEGSFCQVKEIDAIPPTWFVRLSRNITARHGDGCNLSFADGSCRYWKYRDKRTIAMANWELSPDDASDYNVDLDRMVQLLRGKRK